MALFYVLFHNNSLLEMLPNYRLKLTAALPKT